MKFRFIRYSYLWFGISIALLLVGVGAMINNYRTIGSPLVYGIDFTGGTLTELSFKSAKPAADEITSVIEKAVGDVVEQVNITDQNSYIIQTKDLSNEQHDLMRSTLKTSVGDYEEIRFTTIGPKVGNSLKAKAITSLTVVMIAIVLYIAYAFRHVPQRIGAWRFGLCAIIALFHDALTTVGAFALMKYEVNAFFITALLTVIGFSVHDTIVVFDRIRENLRKMNRDDTFRDVADRSLNETIMRSINTSASTLITLTALYIFGAESIHTFVFALLVGITIGTYSSIFIATPLLVLWQEKRFQK